jgi:chromosome partitioning protein
LKGIILTFYKENTLLSRTVVEEIKKTLGVRVLLHPVRSNVALAEAPGHGRTIFQHDHRSNGATDYSAIAKQIEELA